MVQKSNGGSQALRERIAQLCTSLWGGNASQMAKELQISQPVASRVLRGGQPPSAKLIENLARDPRVNLAWLLRGEGAPGDREAGCGVPVPIAKQLLPGPPADHAHLLSGDFFGLAPNYYRESRYWLEIQPTDPVLTSEIVRLKPRDLLLMDAGREAISAEERFFGDLCGVRVSGDEGASHKLARVTYVPGSDEDGASRLEADTFDLAPNPKDIVTERVIREFRGQTRMVTNTYRLKQSRTTGKQIRVPLGELELEPSLPTIVHSDIVSVCILVVRRRPNDP